MRRLICVGATGLALAVAGCGGGNEYPEAVENEFMTSCLARAGTSAKSCRCLFEGLKDEFSYDELKRAEVALMTGTRPPQELAEQLVDVIADCVE